MKRLIKTGLAGLLLTTMSCTQMLNHRDYLSEMDQEDATFYQPYRDFPVVAGDTGRTWESDSERRMRTPASEDEGRDDRQSAFLKQELRRLESKQSDSAFELYDKYKSQMTTTSQKIYFLKLPLYERNDYLLSRGFIKTESEQTTNRFEGRREKKNQINLGMTKSDVMNNLGSPSRVEVAGNPTLENERWLYSHNGASSYIYFESGHVEGWE